VAFFSDIADFISNSKLWCSCQAIHTVATAFQVCSPMLRRSTSWLIRLMSLKRHLHCLWYHPKATNCCRDIMSECLAILDKVAKISFGISVLYFDIEGTLLK
jgi:hypothetical protein